MNNSIKNNERIENLIKSNDFNELYNFLLSSVTPFDVYRVFLKQQLKKKNNLFSKEEFWVSELPNYYLKELLQCDLSPIFYESYFKKDEFCNCGLNEHMIIISTEDFILWFKSQKAFKHKTFLQSLIRISDNCSFLKQFVLEIKKVNELDQTVQKNIAEENIKKLLFSFGELSKYYIEIINNIKRSTENYYELAQYENTIITELQNVIKLFRENNSKFLTFNEFPFFCDISTLNFYNKLIHSESQINKIEMYCNGYLDIMTSQKKYFAKQNSKYSNYIKNNIKYLIEESYLYYTDLKKSYLDINKIDPSMQFWGFYNLPEVISYREEKIEIKKVLKFLKSYSKDIPIENIRTFPISFWIDDISKSFNWTKNEVKSIIDFLTFDITDSNEKSFWLYKPLIREGNTIFWFGTLLQNRRWEVILYNRIKVDKEIKCIYKEVPISEILPFSFEEKVKKLFHKNNFITLGNKKFKTLKGETGEIDLLAFKDNVLFVCEVKTSLKSDEFTFKDDTENKILKNNASYQVKKANAFIREDLKNILCELKVDNLTISDELQIVNLIVTDFYSGDIQQLDDEVLKTTLLELEINFKNNKKELFENYIHFTLNSRNQHLSQQSLNQFSWDIWNEKKEFHSSILVNNIKKNRVWSAIDSIWEFEPKIIEFE